jgi:hypothetical protein
MGALDHFAYEERAAIAEFDGGLSRADAEAQAIREIYDHLQACQFASNRDPLFASNRDPSGTA